MLPHQASTTKGTPVNQSHSVRRVGKAVLARSIPNAEYLGCERPRTRVLVADPEGFLPSVQGRAVLLDQIHRLPNPAEHLTIAADTSAGRSDEGMSGTLSVKFVFVRDLVRSCEADGE